MLRRSRQTLKRSKSGDSPLSGHCLDRGDALFIIYFQENSMQMMMAKFVLALLLLSGGCFARAQNAGDAARRTNAQLIDFLVSYQEQRIMDIAEVMPEEKYGFAPTQGEFKGVRTFGRQLVHLAADNYILGAAILGENPSVDVGTNESGSTSAKTKAEIMAYVKGSFEYMRRAAAANDDKNAVIPTPKISPWPKGTATRMGMAIEDCVHTWDHYGQLVEYLRMNGIIPPESRRQPA